MKDLYRQEKPLQLLEIPPLKLQPEGGKEAKGESGGF